MIVQQTSIIMHTHKIATLMLNAPSRMISNNKISKCNRKKTYKREGENNREDMKGPARDQMTEDKEEMREDTHRRKEIPEANEGGTENRSKQSRFPRQIGKQQTSQEEAKSENHRIYGNVIDERKTRGGRRGTSQKRQNLNSKRYEDNMPKGANKIRRREDSLEFEQKPLLTQKCGKSATKLNREEPPKPIPQKLKDILPFDDDDVESQQQQEAAKELFKESQFHTRPNKDKLDIEIFHGGKKLLIKQPFYESTAKPELVMNLQTFEVLNSTIDKVIALSWGWVALVTQQNVTLMMPNMETFYRHQSSNIIAISQHTKMLQVQQQERQIHLMAWISQNMIEVLQVTHKGTYKFLTRLYNITLKVDSLNLIQTFRDHCEVAVVSEEKEKQVQMVNWLACTIKHMGTTGEVKYLNYSKRTLIVVNDFFHIHLFRRQEFMSSDQCLVFKPVNVIRELKIKKAIVTKNIEDIIVMDSDIFVLERGKTVVHSFQIQRNGLAEYRSTLKYGFDLALEDPIIVSENPFSPFKMDSVQSQKLIFDGENKLVFIVNCGDDVYYAKTDEFLKNREIRNIGHAPSKVGNFIALRPWNEGKDVKPRVYYTLKDSQVLINWNVKV